MPPARPQALPSARPGPAPARTPPALDRVDLGELDDERRRLAARLDGLAVLEALVARHGDDADLWRRLAGARFEMGDRRGSVRALRRARDLAPACPDVEADLRAVGGHVVPDWHFAMLADRARNRAYREAIERAVRPGATVLELGAGSGLLSMFAARAGARRVTACEVSGVLADTAADIVARNGLADVVSVVDHHSTQVRIGPDLPERADVLISELLDPTLLAEGVLPSVRDARNRLLTRDAVVLPVRAVVWAVLVEARSREASVPVGRIEGLDLSPMETLRDPDRAVVTRLTGEPVRFLTEPFAALEVDLSATTAAGSRCRRTSVVPAVESGTVHGVGWWFELFLDGQTSLSTGPDEGLHWPQVLQLSSDRRAVRPGDRVEVEATHDDVCVTVRI